MERVSGDVRTVGRGTYDGGVCGNEGSEGSQGEDDGAESHVERV